MDMQLTQSLGHDSFGAPQPSRVLPLFSIQGRTAIVTGAGAGIGLAIVEALAEAGANVAIFYHSNKSAIPAAAKIKHTYGVQCKCKIRTRAVLERYRSLLTSYFSGHQAKHTKWISPSKKKLKTALTKQSKT
jgi:hypothetical protein